VATVSTISERLRERILREGPISFSEFMEAALYDPEEGYYARRAAIGEPGDFVTSPAVSAAFAATLARRFAREAAALEGPVDFVEVGAGDGRFLKDFGARVAAEDPELAARVRWTAVERASRGRDSLARIALPGPLRVLAGPADLAPASVRGWIFSNELFDALPVVRLVGAAEGPRERRVGLADGAFAWTERPADPSWVGHLASFRVALIPGQVAEIAPAAPTLYGALARALARGSLVTFDYGHRAATLYHPLARPSGTLAVHSGGRRGGDPLARPGEVDLSAHVNWDALVRAGESEGLATRGVFRQGTFLAEGGIFDFAANDREKWRAFRLIDPEGMGEELSVLIQTR